MTLVLAPPGAGKSQFLKALGGHMRHDPLVRGDLLYAGLASAEHLRTGVYTEKLCALVAQGDVHMANLTVRETMQFALDNSVVPPSAELFGQPSLDPKLLEYHARKVELLLSVLGLHECADTIAGNDMIRGVSGGQKKRLTISEMLITNARVLLMDEPTTGLDAAVSRDIMVVLKEWCRVSGGTVIAALLQATPECFELYEDLVLMREGHVCYHGPRAEVARFMEQHWGLIAPPEQDLADFIIEVLTNPTQQFEKQAKRIKQARVHRRFPILQQPQPQLQPQQQQQQQNPTAAAAANNNYTNGYPSNLGVGNGHVKQQASQALAWPDPANSNSNAAPERSASHLRFHMGTDVATGDEEDEVLVARIPRPGQGQNSPKVAPEAASPVAAVEAVAPQVPAGAAAAAGAGAAAGSLEGLSALSTSPSLWPLTTSALVGAYKASPYFLLQRSAVDQVQAERGARVAALKLAPARAHHSAYTIAQYGRLYTRGFRTHLSLALGRQMLLLLRNKQTVPPRAFSAIIQSLIFGR